MVSAKVGCLTDNCMPASASIAFHSITDEELCTDYWPDPHQSGACYCHLVTNFGRVLRGVASGTKINSRRCEDIGRSTIFGLARQGHLNNGAVSASVLREIRDLQEMIVRHSDYECRIVAGDDLALGRIGESNCCGSENKRSDKKSRGERLHDSQINRELYFGYRNRRGPAMTHRFSRKCASPENAV